MSSTSSHVSLSDKESELLPLLTKEQDEQGGGEDVRTIKISMYEAHVVE